MWQSQVLTKDSRFDQWTVERLDDKRSPLYSHREDLDELVVGAEFHDPLQFTVSLARGMLSDLAFDQGPYRRPSRWCRRNLDARSAATNTRFP